MVNLTLLTPDEMEQVSTAFTLLDNARDLLVQRDILDEAEGIDLAALYHAVHVEGRRQALTAIQRVCAEAVKAEHLEPVVREDGEIGFILTEAGIAFVEGLTVP